MDRDRGHEGNEAPFNMAIATLMRIAAHLEKISIIDVGIYPDGSSIGDMGEAQHLKKKLVYQLFMQSIPLLASNKNFKREDIEEKFKKINLQWRGVRNNRGEFMNYEVVFNPDVDKKLNDIQAEIQLKLQKEGYFMPPKNSPGSLWKKSM